MLVATVTRSFARLWLLFCCLLCSCVSVEFDRMVGTSFPTPQLANGTEVDIHAIYADAGFRVSVEEDDTDIPQLNIPANQCISDAELDALEAVHRDAPLFPDNNTYYLYGVVVNHYGEVLDACIPDWVLGKMWNHHTRSAFAIFYLHSSVVAGSPEYLRTTVHEIGHALNLHHEDGDGATTIMTQTGDLAEDWTFQFSADSVDHLQNHPDQCKYPGAIGGALFEWVTPAHFAWHANSGLTSYDCD